jgi:hypothetical protein
MLAGSNPIREFSLVEGANARFASDFGVRRCQ